MCNEADTKKENYECVTTINNYDTKVDSEMIQILINQFVTLINFSEMP